MKVYTVLKLINDCDNNYVDNDEIFLGTFSILEDAVDCALNYAEKYNIGHENLLGDDASPVGKEIYARGYSSSKYKISIFKSYIKNQ